MAVQDKTDFRWNGKLAGEGINAVYYDLINVDITNVPYATTQRNSSFFLKTRENYEGVYKELEGYTILDVKFIYKDKCDRTEGAVYAMARKGKVAYIFGAPIINGCIGAFMELKRLEDDGCRDWKLFTTNYVCGFFVDCSDTSLFEPTGGGEKAGEPGNHLGIQINQYNLGTTQGLLSDKNVESGYYNFKNIKIGSYVLIYSSLGGENDGFAGQVRMIVGIDSEGRIMLDAPWQGFKTPTFDTQLDENKFIELTGENVNYRIFDDWGEVVGFADNNSIYVVANYEDTKVSEVFHNITTSNIVGVASAADKIFILTDSGFVSCSQEGVGYDKFFINYEMDAGADKTSIVAYRDTIICFGNRHIAVGVPEQRGWTMYNQSNTVGTRSRYSYGEYDGDMLLVTNDRRLVSMTIADNVSKHMLQFQDVGLFINSKLSSLVSGDECFIGEDNNELRVFVHTKSDPYIYNSSEQKLDFNDDDSNSLLHIYKYNKQFKARTEDLLEGLLLYGCRDGGYFGQDGIYVKGNNYGFDKRRSKNKGYKAIIKAFLVENETNGMDGQPDLFMLAKLNRLITTLGPGKYSDLSRIHIQSYWQGIGVDYEFPIGTGDDTIKNKRIDYISKAFNGEENEIDPCQLGAIQDSQKKFGAKCLDKELRVQSLVPLKPWCTSKNKFYTTYNGVCVNDSLYRFAPTMPLVTSLGENQNYSTQIKLELISEGGDVVSFGGWLAELFIAPLGLTGPDGEYLLPAETDCNK